MTTQLETQLINAAVAGNYTEFNRLVGLFTTTTATQTSQADRSLIVNEVVRDITDSLNFGNPSVVSTASAALRTFMVKFGASTRIDAVDEALVNLAVAADYANSKNYDAIDAITDNLTTQDRAALDHFSRETIINSIAQNVADAQYDARYFDTSALETASATALRDFMVKFGASTRVDAVDEALVNLAVAADYANSKNYDAIDAITDNLTTQDRAALDHFSRETIINSIAQNVADAQYDARYFDTSALETASATALRDFMVKFGASTRVDAVDEALVNLAVAADYANSKNYDAIDAITDNLTTQDRAALDHFSRETIINSIAQNVADAQYDARYFDTSALETASATALRDFMVKFGASTRVDAVDEALVNLAVAADYANSKNYDAIDAITDNLTTQDRAALDHFSRETIINSIAQNVADAQYDARYFDTSALETASAAALRDFMVKFGASTRVDAVDEALVNLAVAADYANSANYDAIDAITDNLTTQDRAALDQWSRETILKNISTNITDGVFLNNQTLVNGSMAALRDFMEKFGSTNTAYAIESSLLQLGSIKASASLDSIFDNSSDALLDSLSSATRTLLQANSIYLGKSTGDTISTSSTATVNDIVYGLSGNDVIRVYAGNDIVFGGNGIDIAYLGTGNDTAYGDAGSDTLYGEAGNDVLFGGTANDILNGGDGDDKLYGENENDLLYGGNGNDILAGGAGNDQMDGGTGADNMSGGAGDDTFIVDNVGDVVVETSGQGYDRVLSYVNFNGSTEGLINSLEVIQLMGTAYTATGSNLNNQMTGNDVANVLYGMLGDDTMEGRGGNDILFGDSLFLAATTGGNDRLWGNDGNDTLYGAVGNDWLSGGNGTDTLSGGSGADRFIFDGFAMGTGVDRVTDFSRTAGDILDFSDIFASNSAQSAINSFVFARNSGTDTIFSVDKDGAGTAHGKVDVAVLSNMTNVSVSDWFKTGNIDVTVG